MEELVGIIGNVGFPIAVAVYLLIRIEGRLQDLSEAIMELREAIITLPRDPLVRPMPLKTGECTELTGNTVQ
jgi:hypothetical protein